MNKFRRRDSMNDRFEDSYEDFILDKKENINFPCNSHVKCDIINRLNFLNDVVDIKSSMLKKYIKHSKKMNDAYEELFNKNIELEEDNKYLRELTDIGRDSDSKSIVDALNDYSDENYKLKKENKKLKQLLDIICFADCITPHDDVKDILKEYVSGLDSVSYEYSSAWNEYCLLSDFFKEMYDEEWNYE